MQIEIFKFHKKEDIMIHYDIGKEILDALFNINLYGDDDLAQDMIANQIAYQPITFTNEQELAKYTSSSYSVSSIDKTRFDLTRKNERYFDYNDFDRIAKKSGQYVTERYFTLTSKAPNTIEFESGRNCYVGLFTAMPTCTVDEQGKRSLTWGEPDFGDYRRINLHRGIISDDISLNTASIDIETGGAMVDNKELIVFPEAFKQDREGGWGEIVGFGIFTDPDEGEPMLWGRLKSPVEVDEAHIPLFKKADFKIVLA